MLTRREVCERLIQLVLAGGFAHVSLRYICGSDRSVRRVSFSELPREGEVIFKEGVWLAGQKNDALALSDRCPHLGCRLMYDTEKDCFRCPCHGSRFSLRGEWLAGPANKDMKMLEIRQDGQDGTWEVKFET